MWLCASASAWRDLTPRLWVIQTAVKMYVFENVRDAIAKDPSDVTMAEGFMAGAIAGSTAQVRVLLGDRRRWPTNQQGFDLVSLCLSADCHLSTGDCQDEACVGSHRAVLCTSLQAGVV